MTGCTRIKDTMYRIYITRSGTNVANTDSITWRANIGSDVYTPGISSVSATTDFRFKTYDDGILDQQMITDDQGYVVWDTGYLWQEFVAGAE